MSLLSRQGLNLRRDPDAHRPIPSQVGGGDEILLLVEHRTLIPIASEHLPQTLRQSFFAAILFTILAIAACSSEPSGDPAGFSCEYEPFGASPLDFLQPDPDDLGGFDLLARVRITGHEVGETAGGLVSFATVEDPVAGDVSDGVDIELHSDFRLCLETGDDYYVIADSRAGDDYFEIPHPWSTFPVINNRITLHPDMRKDDLIGRFHGLDPILFKRQFVDYTSRDDIEVE